MNKHNDTNHDFDSNETKKVIETYAFEFDDGYAIIEYASENKSYDDILNDYYNNENSSDEYYTAYDDADEDYLYR